MNLKFNQSWNKKSQLTIFVIIGIIVIVTVLFISITSSSQSKVDIESQTTQSLTQEFNIYNLYEASESCLLLATRKAILLASVRGGLIYPHERSIEFQTSLNSLEFTQIYLTNLELDLNSIQRFMQPGLTTELYLASLTTQDVKKDLSHYITRDFVRCQLNSFNSTEFSDLSYSILNTQSRIQIGDNYSYELKQMKDINSSKILLYKNDGSIIEGKLDNDNNKVVTDTFFDSNEIVVAVLDEAFKIVVEAENFRVVSRIETIDSFSSSSTAVDRGEIKVQIQTPLFSLINDLKIIFQTKVMDRSFSFTNQTQLEQLSLEQPIINNFEIRVSNLVSNENEIFQEIVLTSLENRNFDFDSIVSLYRNTAPIIINNTPFVVLDSTNPNFLLNEDYIEGIEHNEFEDNFLLRGREFEFFEDDIIRLLPNGTFELKTSTGFYTYTFYATDGELFTPFEVTFNLAGATNENNRDVNNCFDIYYNLGTLDLGYDTLNTIIDNQTRKINLLSRNNDGILNWVGIVAAGQSNNVQVSVVPKSSCFTSPPATQTFTLGNGQFRDVSITADDIDVPFEFRIGATDCLGPTPLMSGDGFTGSCCNMDRIFDLIVGGFYDQLRTEDFIYESGTVALIDEEDMYMCVENPQASLNSHWGDLNFLKTQNLTTKLRVVCQGNSPILEENLLITTGSNNLGTFTPLDYPSNTAEINFETTGDFYNVCQECRILPENESYVLEDIFGSKISIGFEAQTQNSDDGIYLNEDRTIDRVVEDVCYEDFQQRQCQNGIPSWVTISSSEVDCS
ncbi:MAG: hypothetical protein LAT82_01370 [Nanoarchaeota archaeon]|nr:hypothetical protein [Nanoarchaeota archaeon]